MKKKVRWTMLLSHHTPEQYCRTYNFFGIRICARCFGLPIGIVVGFILDLTIPIWTLFLLPIPTFLNFLLQELNVIKSRNLIKTILTIPLGILLLETLSLLTSSNFSVGLGIIIYLLTLEFLVAFLMNRQGKLESFMRMYEKGVYKE